MSRLNLHCVRSGQSLTPALWLGIYQLFTQGVRLPGRERPGGIVRTYRTVGRTKWHPESKGLISFWHRSKPLGDVSRGAALAPGRLSRSRSLNFKGRGKPFNQADLRVGLRGPIYATEASKHYKSGLPPHAPWSTPLVSYFYFVSVFSLFSTRKAALDAQAGCLSVPLN